MIICSRPQVYIFIHTFSSLKYQRYYAGLAT